MSPRAPDVPEQVRQFAPKEPPPAPKERPPRSDGDVLDQVGQAIVGLLQHAANEACDRATEKLSIRLRDAEDRCDRAVSAAEKLSIGLREAEDRCDRAVNELCGANDRINQLQAELEQCRDRAQRAEDWLQRIYQEIEETLTRSRHSPIRPIEPSTGLDTPHRSGLGAQRRRASDSRLSDPAGRVRFLFDSRVNFEDVN
jgi:chemotaxis protein histidine kinase CheA